jgi:hypothetical protein
VRRDQQYKSIAKKEFRRPGGLPATNNTLIQQLNINTFFMTNKIILFLTLLSYSVIISQSFMYMLSLKNTQLALGGGSYTELRQLIDANMRGTFKYVLYAALLTNLLLVIVNIQRPSSMLFITAAIALLALIADILLTVKGSLPLNDIINNWSPEHFPDNWKEIRNDWFRVFRYRQVINIAGFISLLAGTAFGGK